eukprot:symbB.v1.2.001750.t1/scaffold94.1/size335129/14
MPSFKAFADFQKKAKEAHASKSDGSDVRSDVFQEVKPEAMGSTPPVAKELQIGMTVRVKGLQARPELNGLEGVLTFREEEKGRWKVELKNGGGAKLFKDGNLEPYISDQDALNILRAPVQVKERRQEEPVASPVPSASGAPVMPAPAERERPKSFLERSRAAEAPGQVSEAAKAAAAAVAKGAKAAGDDGLSEVSTSVEDDEAFVRSIEQCLKECDVMWDDY